MTETQLFRLKKEVDEAKTKTAELNGQKTALMRQLKEEWKCTTIEEAIAKGKTMAADIEKLDNQINEALEEIDLKYNQNNE